MEEQSETNEQDTVSTTSSVINIIKRDEDKSAILDEDALKQILLHDDAKDCYVALYSICGTKRTGKSFLWNQFIRYLDDPSKFQKDIKSKKVMNKFFEWRAGEVRHTEGILVYKTPFIKETSKYGKVALFLMDTQGMFDNIESGENCGMIVALSFLISSIQVYNVSHRIDSNNLQYSYKFSKVWKFNREKGKEADVKSFFADNALFFVVRDWRRKKTHKLGLEGGQEYVDTLMEINESQAEDQRHVRREIKNNFLKVSGFLLPEPGEDIVDIKPGVTECSFKDVDEVFYKNIQNLFEHLVDEKNIEVKTVEGYAAKGSDIYADIVKTAKLGEGFAGVSENFRSFVEHDYKMKMKKLVVKHLTNYIAEMCKKIQEHAKNGNFEWKKLIKTEQNVSKKKNEQDSGDDSKPGNLPETESSKEKFQTNENLDAKLSTDASVPYQEHVENVNVDGRLIKKERIALKGEAENESDSSKLGNEKLSESKKSDVEKSSDKSVAKSQHQDENDSVNWSELVIEHHVNLKNEALDQYDKDSKPGDEIFQKRWRSNFEKLIDMNFSCFENCAKAEEVFNRMLLEYNGKLRSSVSGERLKRMFNPLDSAKERSKEALEVCKQKIREEIDKSIAEQCYEYCKLKANMLLEEHLRRLKIIRGIAVGAGAAVIGAAAAATLFAIPAVLGAAIAAETSTALIVGATVGGGATFLSGASSVGVAIDNYRKGALEIVEDNWDYDGDDIGFVKADVEVVLSFGVVRFPQVTKLEKNVKKT